MDDDTASSAPQPRRKAFSYLRFSTPEQSKGNSFDRQIGMARAYAEKHDLDLDQELTFHDVGVSAYRGQNADAGRLACFVEAVRSGQVPQGSLLLVEQLDRISRMSPLRALDVLRSIVSEGVGLVTMNDGKVYTKESLEGLPMDLIISILTFTRANEESATKAKRLRSAWDAKRATLKDRSPITARLPGWLRLNQDRTAFEEIPERVHLIRRIFDMSLAGEGYQRIASTFNEEGVEPWGPGRSKGKFWQRSYIAKVLANPAVIGQFTPHVLEFEANQKVKRALEPVDGYFPAIISEETFREAQVLRQGLGAPQRGKHAHAPVSNILATLAACPKCGATMTRVVKGKRSKPSYVCTKAKSKAGCEYRSVRCDLIEAAVFNGLPERLKNLEGATGNVEGLDEEIEACALDIDALEQRIDFYIDELFYVQSDELRQAMHQKLESLKREQETAKTSLQRLQERREIASGLTVQARVQRVLEVLQPSEGEPTAADVNRALRLVFKRAIIRWSEGALDFEWHHGGTCRVHFTTFTKQPGPGWRWEDQENDNDDDH